MMWMRKLAVVFPFEVSKVKVRVHIAHLAP